MDIKLNCVLVHGNFHFRRKPKVEEIFQELKIPYELDLDEKTMYVTSSNIAFALEKLSYDNRILLIEIV